VVPVHKLLPSRQGKLWRSKIIADFYFIKSTFPNQGKKTGRQSADRDHSFDEFWQLEISDVLKYLMLCDCLAWYHREKR
jgi:hypothetical protein